MSIACTKCGSLLAEGQSFCTACGMRAQEQSAPEVPRFCTGCGAPLSRAGKFCEKCGASVNGQQTSPSAELSPSSAARFQVVHTPAQVSPQASAPTKSGSHFLRFVMIAAALFVLLLLVAMGSCAYIAYRAKQRINKVEEAYNKDDLSGMVAAATGQTAKP